VGRGPVAFAARQRIDPNVSYRARSGNDTLPGVNTTALIGQWSMEGARRDLESRSRSANDIRALLLGENRDDQVEAAGPPVWDGDGDAPVFFKDPGDAHWNSLEDAAVALGNSKPVPARA
jgi:hypothetical protein